MKIIPRRTGNRRRSGQCGRHLDFKVASCGSVVTSRDGIGAAKLSIGMACRRRSANLGSVGTSNGPNTIWIQVGAAKLLNGTAVKRQSGKLGQNSNTVFGLFGPRGESLTSQ